MLHFSSDSSIENTFSVKTTLKMKDKIRNKSIIVRSSILFEIVYKRLKDYRVLRGTEFGLFNEKFMPLIAMKREDIHNKLEFIVSHYSLQALKNPFLYFIRESFLYINIYAYDKTIKKDVKPDEEYLEKVVNSLVF